MTVRSRSSASCRAAKPSQPHVQIAIDYAGAVLAGKIAACIYVRQACDRFLKDIRAAQRNDSVWDFRPHIAEAAMMFAEWLPNIKGPKAGQLLELMPWQCFVFANLFGFYERGTDARRFRQGVVFVPRGNGKTSMAAPAVLYMTFMENEGGAEGYAAAVTRGQARILFDTAQNMVKRSPMLRREAGIETSANAIFQRESASKFVPISSDAKALDGLNVHVAVCDEIASHKTSEVYDVLLTAMGKRLNPLLLSISTATSNSSGIGKQLWDYSVRVLAGAQVDERLFAVIYSIDTGDDPWSEETWVKANPSWGVSVQPDAVRAIMRQARQNPAQEMAAMTRHLNIWVGADDALFSTRAWRLCANPRLRLEDFEGRDCHIALDLASKTDLAAVSLTFPTLSDDGRQLTYATFARCYLNEAAVMEARNPSYPGWAADGYLTISQGNETDFSLIENDLLDFCGRFRVLSVAFDPWAATHLAQRLTAEGVPMVEFRASTQNFSEPTKELDAAMQAGRIEHDGNPVLEWCLGNVVGHYDARSNVYPRKARPENKIDAAIATIMGIARCLAAKETESAYNTPAGRQFVII
jgi:phage terminase large subunit-like protein